ncbi:MAG: hypothetical protein OXO48_03605 [Caldilineaceae bacterium]|nr:hypothetical protein [Caldilineaceae bacterium]
MSDRTETHVELGRKTESGKHATDPPEKLFGRLIAMELITISLFEAIPNNNDLSHVRRELLGLFQNAEEVVITQIRNYPKSKITARANSNRELATDSFRASINEAIDYLDEMQ